ncbi:uncharacterized protein LOC124686601 [Lolium rigidum]|uniref:uncharacterized protein LOC124686601 n=1 Tax=Lolium rigidum TaxID=89674 RepID=UPI001F5D0B85|nr:uncharacterized protein LOC124686601 [Lolium rigidum]
MLNASALRRLRRGHHRPSATARPCTTSLRVRWQSLVPAFSILASRSSFPSASMLAKSKAWLFLLDLRHHIVARRPARSPSLARSRSVAAALEQQQQRSQLLVFPSVRNACSTAVPISIQSASGSRASGSVANP